MSASDEPSTLQGVCSTAARAAPTAETSSPTTGISRVTTAPVAEGSAVPVEDPNDLTKPLEDFYVYQAIARFDPADAQQEGSRPPARPAERTPRSSSCAGTPPTDEPPLSVSARLKKTGPMSWLMAMTANAMV